MKGFSQTSSLSISVNFCLYTARFEDEREGLTDFAVFLFIVSHAFYGWSFLLLIFPKVKKLF